MTTADATVTAGREIILDANPIVAIFAMTVDKTTAATNVSEVELLIKETEVAVATAIETGTATDDGTNVPTTTNGPQWIVPKQ
jgi:hypothetical protein